MTKAIRAGELLAEVGPHFIRSKSLRSSASDTGSDSEAVVAAGVIEQLLGGDVHAMPAGRLGRSDAPFCASLRPPAEGIRRRRSRRLESATDNPPVFAPPPTMYAAFSSRPRKRAARSAADAAGNDRRRLDRRASGVRPTIWPTSNPRRAPPPIRRRAGREEPLPAPVDAPLDQRADLDRPAARHPPGLRVAGRTARLDAPGPARGDGMPRPDALGSAAQRPSTRRRKLHRLRPPARDASPRQRSLAQDEEERRQDDDRRQDPAEHARRLGNACRHGAGTPGAAAWSDLRLECASNALKKPSATLAAAELTSREPIWAILPPTWALASYFSSVASPSGESLTSAWPLPKPATPPWPSN